MNALWNRICAIIFTIAFEWNRHPFIFPDPESIFTKLKVLYKYFKDAISNILGYQFIFFPSAPFIGRGVQITIFVNSIS